MSYYNGLHIIFCASQKKVSMSCSQ
jgi:hypothetical protein